MAKGIKSGWEKLPGSEIYNFTDKEAREKSVAFLYSYAKSERAPQEAKWVKYDDYYSGRHAIMGNFTDKDGESAVPFAPAPVPDAWIHVESQIVPEIPDFQFNGRDKDLDSAKAKQREYAVKFVIENNRISDKNTSNERRLLKLGDAFWKVRWDKTKFFPGSIDNGDIVIDDVDPSEIFPDPSARELQDGEFVIHAYPMHRRKAARLYGKEIKKAGLTIEEITEASGGYTDTEIYNSETIPQTEDCVQVIEFYYRTDDDRVGLSMQINGKEIKNVADFWEKTGDQNKNFPFVQYWRIKNDNSLWNTSELEPAIPLIDAADRELAVTMLNRAFMANDIVVMEEDALTEGTELSNEPGAVISVKPQRINSVQRMPGRTSSGESVSLVDKYTEMIERTVGNYDSTMGQEPTRVTTASGIAQLNDRADARKSIKRADRLMGFERLYMLVDWFCLEFYDDNRLIFLGAGTRGVSAETPSPGKARSVFAGDTKFPRNPFPASGGDVGYGAGENETQGVPGTGQGMQGMPQMQGMQGIPQMQGMTGIPQGAGQEPQDMQGMQGMQGVPGTTPGMTQGTQTNLDEKNGPVIFRYNSDAFKVANSINPLYDAIMSRTNEGNDESRDYYFPNIDCVISAGEGTRRSRAFTMSVLENLVNIPVTMDNYKLVCALIEQTDIPQAQDLIEDISARVEEAKAQAEAQQAQQMQAQQAQIQAQQMQAQQQASQAQGQGQGQQGQGQQGQGQQPQGQAQNTPSADQMQAILTQLSPEEQDELQKNPQLLMQAGLA